MGRHRLLRIMHRFMIECGSSGEKVPLTAEETAHALKVLRLHDGDEVQALTAEGSAYCAVLRIDGGSASVELGQRLPSNEAPVRVTLYMGLPKGEKLELIAQKITELGAASLVPVRMERCVARIEPKEAEKKLSRVVRISQEAQKQSGRQKALNIEDPINLDELTARIPSHDAVYLLWEEARGYRLADACREHPEYTDIAYIVGPEGGITEKEAEKLASAGAVKITMGPRILRAETAAIAGCTSILTLWGDI